MVSVLLLAAVLAQAEPLPAADDRAAVVAALVRELESTDVSKRDSAEKELTALGPSTLALLPADSAGSADLVQRLKRVRQALEKRATDQLTRGSTFSISGKMTLKELCASIEKQTDNKIIDYRQKFGQNETNPQLALEIKNAPFWQALDVILDKTNLTIYHFSGREGLALIDRDRTELPRSKRATYAGPLRMEVTRLVAERRPAVENATLKVNLEIAWEPRMEPITFLQPLKDIEAIDDQGNPLKLDMPDSTLEAPSQGGTGAELVIPFVAPPHSASSIASLKGTLTAIVSGKVEAFEFDKLGDAAKPAFKPLEMKKGAASVVLEQVRKNNDIWEVLLRVRFDDATGSLESHRSWILQNEAFLMGPDKKPVEKAGFFSTMRSEKELGMGYQFEITEPIEKYSFVYKSASSINSLPLKYEIKNLPLP